MGLALETRMSMAGLHKERARMRTLVALLRIMAVAVALSPLCWSQVGAQRALAAGPSGSVQSLLQHAQAAFDKKDYRSARALFAQGSVLAPKNAVAWAGKARSESYLGGDWDAVRDYDRAISLDPRSALYRYRQGVSYMNLSEDTKAVADYSAAIQRDPRMGDAYVNRGYLEDAQGAYAAAIADDTQGLRLEPRWWQGYFNRGQTYLSLKEWQASVGDLTVYIKHTARASCACAYYERGNAYFNLSEYARAYADHKQAIALGPVEAGYFERLGADAYVMGKYEEAIAASTVSLDADPSDAFSYYYRGMAREAIGDKSGALADLQESVQLYSEQGESDHAQVARTALQHLQTEIAAITSSPSATPESLTSPVGSATPSATSTGTPLPTTTVTASPAFTATTVVSPSPSITPVAGS
jgi:tetratricopeptide (TPR) repeat protein